MSPLRRRSPPFALQLQPIDDVIHVYCGPKAFYLAKPLGPPEERATSRPASLAFPKSADPSSYAWPVDGREVLVFPKGEPKAEIDTLVMELLHQGAYRVMVYENGDYTDYDLRDRA